MFEGDPQENIKRDFRRLAADVAALRESLMTGNREKVEHFKDAVREQFDWARGEAAAKAQKVDSYVKEKPWVAVGIAAAVGAAIALLLSHSKHQE